MSILHPFRFNKIIVTRMVKLEKPEGFRIYLFLSKRKLWVETGWSLIFTKIQPYYLFLTLLKHKLQKLLSFG